DPQLPQGRTARRRGTAGDARPAGRTRRVQALRPGRLRLLRHGRPGRAGPRHAVLRARAAAGVARRSVPPTTRWRTARAWARRPGRGDRGAATRVTVNALVSNLGRARRARRSAHASLDGSVPARTIACRRLSVLLELLS